MGTLLSIRNLETSFFTRDGELRAVDGVTCDIEDGTTMGLVGESGCGKSVTALSVMRLLPSGVGRIVGGEIIYRGKNLAASSDEEMRHIRGNEISMIFQEPMTSLNPVFTVGEQIGEAGKVLIDLRKVGLLGQGDVEQRFRVAVGRGSERHVSSSLPDRGSDRPSAPGRQW